MIDPLYLFVFAGLFSPGPNVIMLTASGARFGFRRTLPHLAGVVVGVGLTAGLTGLGIGALLAARPLLLFGLECAAAVWILWMAWKLWQSARVPRAEQRDRPMTFVQGALFQWVNPKVWAVALAAAAGYGAGLGPVGEALRLALAFSGLNLVVCLFWSAAGAALALLLARPAAWAAFTKVMAALLALSAALVFL